MSLLREIAANFGQISNVLDANNLAANFTELTTLGGSILTVPEDFVGSLAIPEEGVVFVGLSVNPYTVIFDPKTLYVGRVVIGAQMAVGSIAFAGAEGTNVTIYNVNGQPVTPNTPAIFQGGYGAVVCTERTETSATLRFFIGTFGSPTLRIVSASTTGNVPCLAGVTKNLGYNTGAITYQVNPGLCCPYGQTCYFTQIGSGTSTLGAAPGKTVIYLDPTGTQIPGPTLTQGQSITFVSVAHTKDSVTLQQLVP